VVLEIDPDTRALMLFGRVGADPCKWYGGVLAPNDKIYTIPYSSPYVLEIDTERRIARPFAMTYPHWGKWSGGILAPNGKIYGIPALSKSVLEIDVEREQTSLYGMLPAGNDLQDKWAGGVLAPNGRIYGMPWRSSSVLEFDPATKAIALLGNVGSANFSWAGGALAKSGRIVAVPYNDPWVLEIGESVCVSNAARAPVPSSVVPVPLASATPQPPVGATPSANGGGDGAATGKLAPVPVPVPVVARAVTPFGANSDNSRTFVLALLGCPDASKASEDACFHLSHRTWHSAMATIMPAGSSLHDIRNQVMHSRLSHVPTNFCFLYNGHALDPNVEGTIKANDVAIVTNPPDTHSPQYIVLIDNVHCNIGPPMGVLTSFASSAAGVSPVLATTILVSMVCTMAYLSLLAYKEFRRYMSRPYPSGYNRVPMSETQEAQSLIDSDNESGKPNLPCLQARLRPLFKSARSPVAKGHPKMPNAEVQLVQPATGMPC